MRTETGEEIQIERSERKRVRRCRNGDVTETKEI